MTPQPRPSRTFQDLSGLGQMLTWVSGLILAISAFTDWYVGSGPGPTTSVIGWHTGALGKLVFVIGLAVLALVILREAGIELPATVPESLVIIALGALSTIFVLIRLISVPDEFFGWRGRGIGIFISLIASLVVIAAGLLRAGEELYPSESFAFARDWGPPLRGERARAEPAHSNGVGAWQLFPSVRARALTRPRPHQSAST
jgi:hypothetical protein